VLITGDQSGGNAIGTRHQRTPRLRALVCQRLAHITGIPARDSSESRRSDADAGATCSSFGVLNGSR